MYCARWLPCDGSMLPYLSCCLPHGTWHPPQGDGTAQLVCRSAHDQAAVCGMLEQDLGLHCTPLTLQPTSVGPHSPAAPEVQCWQHATWQALCQHADSGGFILLRGAESP